MRSWPEEQLVGTHAAACTSAGKIQNRVPLPVGVPEVALTTTVLVTPPREGSDWASYTDDRFS